MEHSKIKEIEYQGNQRGPIQEYSIMDYREIALQIIRQSYPDADFTCFSDRYVLSYWNQLDKVSFTDKYYTIEYPGTWYAGELNLTNDEFVEKLVEDGLNTLAHKDSEAENVQ